MSARRPGSALVFPRDTGWHRLLYDGEGRCITNPSMREMEWVYLNAHVDEVGGEQRRFVVFVAYFTQWLRFLVVRSWSRDGTYLGACTGTTLGRLRATRDRHDLAFKHPGGVDTWSAIDDNFSTELRARDDAGGFSLDLAMHSRRAPYEAGGAGYLPFARSGWFFYYSLTRLDVQGTLSLPTRNGACEDVTVTGLGWFDHQWGDFSVTPFRVPGFEEYEWMSLQLDSGDDLMVTTVWEPHGETPSLDAYGGVGIVRANNGRWEKAVGPTYVARTAFWRSPTQDAVYAAGWTIDVPAWDLHVRVTPRHHDQLTPIVDASARTPTPGVLRALVARAANWWGSFWEGSCEVEGTLGGVAVRGFAFAELVKRYRDPYVEVSIAREGAGFAVLAWRVSGRDPEAPLHTQVFIERATGAVLDVRTAYEDSVLVLDAGEHYPAGAPLRVRVVVASCDGVLRGEGSVTLTLQAP